MKYFPNFLFVKIMAYKNKTIRAWNRQRFRSLFYAWGGRFGGFCSCHDEIHLKWTRFVGSPFSMIPLCTLLATTDSPPFLLDLSLIYLWYLKGGRLSFFIYLFIEKQQNVKQNLEVHLAEDRRLESRLVFPASFLIRTTSWPSNRPNFLRQDLSYEGSVHSRRHSSWQTEKKTTFFLSRGLSEQLKEAGWTMVDLNVDVLQ